MFQILALYLDFEGAKNINVLKVLIWDCIFIFIWIWSLIYDTPMIQISDLYIDFEGTKNMHVL